MARFVFGVSMDNETKGLVTRYMKMEGKLIIPVKPLALAMWI